MCDGRWYQANHRAGIEYRGTDMTRTLIRVTILLLLLGVFHAIQLFDESLQQHASLATDKSVLSEERSTLPVASL
jgi:hypothetical protein